MREYKVLKPDMANLTKTLSSGQRLIWHVALPLNAPAALFWLYCTPKTFFGCATRGFMALGIAAIAMIAATLTTKKGVHEKKLGQNEEANWWLVTTLILFSPFILLFGPLG